MNPSHPVYCASQKGRDAYPIAATAFTAALAVFFLCIPHWSMKLMGAALTVLAMSGVYAFLKSEKWTLSIENSVLSWSYDRWPRSSGQIDLRAVRHMVINDGSGSISATLQDGQSQKLKLLGYGTPLRDFLAQNFPEIAVEFIDGI